MLCARVSPLLVVAAAFVAAPGLAAGQATSQAVGHTASLSPQGAEVDFDLSDGSRLTVAAAGGVVKVNGDSVGSYAPGGPFEKLWRALASKAYDLSTPQLILALRSLPANGMGPGSEQAMAAIKAALPNVSGASLGGRPPDVGAMIGARQIAVDSLNQSISEMSRQISRQISGQVAREIARNG